MQALQRGCEGRDLNNYIRPNSHFHWSLNSTTANNASEFLSYDCFGHRNIISGPHGEKHSQVQINTLFLYYIILYYITLYIILYYINLSSCVSPDVRLG